MFCQRYEECRGKSSFLFTVILSIGGRFSGNDDSSVEPKKPTLSLNQRHEINQLAHSHLAATLFRKEFQLADLQAVLVLSVWNLEGSGRSPDQWILHGHCGQLAYRIGLDTIATRGQSLLSPDRKPSDARSVIERWATLLSWKT